MTLIWKARLNYFNTGYHRRYRHSLELERGVGVVESQLINIFISTFPCYQFLDKACFFSLLSSAPWWLSPHLCHPPIIHSLQLAIHFEIWNILVQGPDVSSTYEEFVTCLPNPKKVERVAITKAQECPLLEATEIKQCDWQISVEP